MWTMKIWILSSITMTQLSTLIVLMAIITAPSLAIAPVRIIFGNFHFIEVRYSLLIPANMNSVWYQNRYVSPIHLDYDSSFTF